MRSTGSAIQADLHGNGLAEFKGNPLAGTHPIALLPKLRSNVLKGTLEILMAGVSFGFQASQKGGPSLTSARAHGVGKVARSSRQLCPPCGAASSPGSPTRAAHHLGDVENDQQSC